MNFTELCLFNILYVLDSLSKLAFGRLSLTFRRSKNFNLHSELTFFLIRLNGIMFQSRLNHILTKVHSAIKHGLSNNQVSIMDQSGSSREQSVLSSAKYHFSFPPKIIQNFKNAAYAIVGISQYIMEYVCYNHFMTIIFTTVIAKSVG